MIWKIQNCFNLQTSCFNQLKKITLVNLRPSNKRGGERGGSLTRVAIFTCSSSTIVIRNHSVVTPTKQLESRLSLELKLNRFQRMIMSRSDMLSPFIPNLRNFQSMSACATFSTDGQMAAAFQTYHPRHELLASGGCLNEHPRLIGHVQITALRARHRNIVIIGHCRKMITPCEKWKGRVANAHQTLTA